ncbi:protein DCL homolog, chloroplastic [Benincasa hispida]|uniref:protein DCL homolog, chloroplastic n=1 Tax=Benincasa hispida TaxID=102211 RepID=UPI0018FFFB41|nr:protein DCL homolog, chloroplastic [Benincasa hispida]
MAASLLLRGNPLLRLGLKHRGLCTGVVQVTRGFCCTSTAASTPPDSNLTSADNTTSVLSASEPPKYQRWDEPDYRKWKDQEEEILGDIEPVISLIKEILHSNRYVDGGRLTSEDEKIVVRLLAHHPHFEDKIGCGIESIMVDRHPHFRHSRCLFVIRTDGGWIDFSYQKCVRAYIRTKYPSYAERFIREHFKRGS